MSLLLPSQLFFLFKNNFITIILNFLVNLQNNYKIYNILIINFTALNGFQPMTKSRFFC